ncbi:two-component system regulatory protein YycI [Xylocopilactobacillus apicola]|uniref:Regulatory protein YycH-like domain-containing protein n=1 Tax=Xylocopilactobacillus apicola TaxID=2932184 RepID=A0AAU9DRT8_9LACO|nr:two-component system regulatory protein YycI [Xylocopilactobacillus apicola]BDR58684.1 hypothetical protein XA3_11250 [Xylocopilactobacillus apicola]
MNFKRIEILFIFVFFFLDIFLFFNYQQTVNVQSNSEKETTVTDAINEMRKDNISVPKVSSTRKQKGYLLSYSHTGANNNEKDSAATNLLQKKVTLKTPITISKKNPVEDLKKFIENNSEINHAQDYVYSKDLSSDKHFVFVQKFQKNLFYDLNGQLSFDLKGNVISDYLISHIDSLSESKEFETIMSEEEAIVKLYTLNEIPNNTRILWRQLAYSWMLEANNVSVYVPTWYIALQNKRTKNITIEKINAFTGALWKASF